MTSTYAFQLADHLGVALCEVTAPLTLTYQRNAAPSAQVQFDLEDDCPATLVNQLASGLPRLKAWRDGALILNAPWAPMRESIDDSDAAIGQVDAVFRGPFALLEQRFTAPSVLATGDAGTVAWGLIDTTNTNDGTTGIALGSIEATATRTETYENKQVAEAITELTAVDGGFDFEVAPVDSGVTTGQFNVYAHQGTDRSVALLQQAGVLFEYGSDTVGNVRAFSRETRFPVNKVRVLGANGLVGTASNASSITRYGTCMVIDQQADVTDQAKLNARATGLLRPDPVQVIEFTPDPELAPQPWTDYWLGDTVTLRAIHGSINVDLSVRVNGVTVTIDSEGNVASTAVTIEQAV